MRPKAKSCFSVCKEKTNFHLIKYTNIPQPLRLKDAVCAGVIKNNNAPVSSLLYYTVVSILCISAKVSVFYQVPAPDLLCIITFSDSQNCFICSDAHFLCHSLQVQLSDPVIQSVLQNTSSLLLLLQRSLHGDDLKTQNFSQVFQTNWARLCRARARV